MKERIQQLENEVLDSRVVVLALLGTVAARVHDQECVAACRKLVDNLQARWGWADDQAHVASFKGVEPMPQAQCLERICSRRTDW